MTSKFATLEALRERIAGVTTTRTIEVKQLDTDFFTDE